MEISHVTCRNCTCKHVTSMMGLTVHVICLLPGNSHEKSSLSQAKYEIVSCKLKVARIRGSWEWLVYEIVRGWSLPTVGLDKTTGLSLLISSMVTELIRVALNYIPVNYPVILEIKPAGAAVGVDSWAGIRFMRKLG